MPFQWIPWPRPINLQLFRSSLVACKSLGNQASGAEIVRPSLNSTLNTSSVIVTFSAAGTTISFPEILIPDLQYLLAVRIHKSLNPIYLRRRKPPTSLQPDRVKPELRNFVLPLNMDMRRFISIASVEEKAVGTGPQYCWHSSSHHIDSPADHQLPIPQSNATTLSWQLTSIVDRRPDDALRRDL